MDFIKRSKVKEFFRKNEIRISGEAYEVVNSELQELFSRAIQRANRNRRGTVMKHDF